LDKRLEFFSRDPIVWRDTDQTDLYRRLIRTKKENQALWSGEYGAELMEIRTSKPGSVFAFTRSLDDNTVICILNLSGKPVRFKLKLDQWEGAYRDVLTEKIIDLPFRQAIQLRAWESLVLVK
jgi:hypothetical protein